MKHGSDLDKITELKYRSQLAVGVYAGVISGFFVIVAFSLYDNLLKLTQNYLIAFVGGIILLIILDYLVIKRPLRKAVKEVEVLCKRRSSR